MNTSDRMGWQGSTPPSLIQQRMEIDRVRTKGLFALWGGGALFLLWLAQLAISGFNALYLLQLVIAISVVIFGARALGDHRHKIQAFEAEHGVGAGRQDPLQ